MTYIISSFFLYLYTKNIKTTIKHIKNIIICKKEGNVTLRYVNHICKIIAYLLDRRGKLCSQNLAMVYYYKFALVFTRTNKKTNSSLIAYYLPLITHRLSLIHLSPILIPLCAYNAI